MAHCVRVWPSFHYSLNACVARPLGRRATRQPRHRTSGEVYLRSGGPSHRDAQADIAGLSFVYFCQAAYGGPIKIGTSRSPWDRVRNLRSEYHERTLRMTRVVRVHESRAFDLERGLHRHYASRLVKGREWFAPCPELVTMARARCAGFYAGIGSRRAPDDVLELAQSVAMHLRGKGWMLRSGHAEGMDQAFQRGADECAEVYLPWATFGDDTPIHGVKVGEPSPDAYELAAQHHPGWPNLKRGARSLHARNCHQVLGADLRSPASFVVCWTPDGSLDGRGCDTGGTGQALRVARAHSVPVFNLARPDHRERIEAMIA